MSSSSELHILETRFECLSKIFLAKKSATEFSLCIRDRSRAPGENRRLCPCPISIRNHFGTTRQLANAPQKWLRPALERETVRCTSRFPTPETLLGFPLQSGVLVSWWRQNLVCHQDDNQESSNSANRPAPWLIDRETCADRKLESASSFASERNIVLVVWCIRIHRWLPKHTHSQQYEYI